MLAARRLDGLASAETGAGVRALIEVHRQSLAEALRGAASDAADPLERIRASAALKLIASA